MAEKEHPHSRIAVVSRCKDCGEEFGRGEFDRNEISAREVEQQQAAALPNREAMSLVNANVAIPVNIAAALNVLSDGSIAYAEAAQTTPIDQSNLPTAPTG
ncbi:MAG TPA: hypothetical protein VJP45_14495 [Candidatus Limnocylindria bacterium]|nr:hypothetical protein [Candidatus Limnocylindria bacterium]